MQNEPIQKYVFIHHEQLMKLIGDFAQVNFDSVNIVFVNVIRIQGPVYKAA